MGGGNIIMKRIKKMLGFLAAAVAGVGTLQAATVQFAVTNTDLTPFTNYLSIYPLATPIYVNGTWSIRGQASKLPFTNGIASINLLQGNYLATNYGYYIAFTVPTNSDSYTVEELVTPGTVGSEWSYVQTNYVTQSQMATASNALYSAISLGAATNAYQSTAGTNITIQTNTTDKLYTLNLDSSITVPGTVTAGTFAVPGAFTLTDSGGGAAQFNSAVIATAFSGSGAGLTLNTIPYTSIASAPWTTNGINLNWGDGLSVSNGDYSQTVTVDLSTAPVTNLAVSSLILTNGTDSTATLYFSNSGAIYLSHEGANSLVITFD